MSIGINRFRHALDMKPDMRVGASRKGLRYQSSQSVNAFLGILYNGVAETLPDRLMGPNSVIIYVARCCPPNFDMGLECFGHDEGATQKFM